MSLIAVYKFEGDGTDYSGNSNTLTNANSTTFTQSINGLGADFGTANTNKRMYKSSTLGLLSTSAVSMSAWVKLNTEISSGDYCFVGKNISGNPFSQVRFDYDYNGGGRRIAIGINSGGGYQVVRKTITLGTSNWYQFAITYTGGTGGTITAYINGVSIGTNTAALNFSGSIDELNIGCLESSLFASAVVDDVKIDNSVLSPGQMKDEYSFNRGFF